MYMFACTEEMQDFWVYVFVFLITIASQHNCSATCFFHLSEGFRVGVATDLSQSLLHLHRSKGGVTTERQLIRSLDCHLKWPECPREGPGEPLQGF